MAAYNTDLKQLHQLCEDLGIPDYSFHQIRHWAGLVATSKRRNKKAVARFLRHDDTAATERYLHALDSEIWEIARQLELEMEEIAATGGVNGDVTLSENERA